jgi:aspartyl-tRNA(Asn)/glutamyl-tRNA(Gln) amidotransferase subunit A
MGRYVLAEDYVRARVGREAIARALDARLEGVDALACPTMPVAAPRLGATTVDIGGSDEPVRNAMLRLTQPFSVGRQPAVTLPCGVTRTEGMPVGLQLAGARGHTTALLRLALAVERALAD